MRFNITEAAAKIGMTRQHFYRKYSGQYTSTKTPDGKSMIEEEELARIAPDRYTVARDVPPVTPVLQGGDAAKSAEVTPGVEVTSLRAQLEAASERESWLRNQLDQANRRTDQVLIQLDQAQKLLAWSSPATAVATPAPAESEAAPLDLSPGPEMSMPVDAPRLSFWRRPLGQLFK
jgi:hypothetical protein